MHKQMMMYLEESDLLSPSQGGFRKNKSTTDTVAKFSDDILLNLNENRCTVAAFVDFRKALIRLIIHY